LINAGTLLFKSSKSKYDPFKGPYLHWGRNWGTMAERARTKRKKKRINNLLPTPKPSTPSKLASLRGLIDSEGFRFGAAFMLSCIGLYAFIHFLPPWFTQPINEHTASTLGLVLNAFGVPVSTAGDTVSDGGLTFRIILECTPIFMMGLFLSFVVFYPASNREKAAGLFMGLPALYLGNLARLSATFIISRYDRSLFEIVHVYLGQVFTIFLVILSCIAWMRWINKKERSRQNISMKAAGFLARFALISGFLFQIWIKAQYWYIRIIDQVVILGFSHFNWNISFSKKVDIYYETFNIITFTSLILASNSVTWSRKIKGLCAGLVVLFLLHLAHRVDNVLIAAFSFSFIIRVDYVLNAFAQYVLPFLMWLIVIRLIPISKDHLNE
jgi:exosortase H (IPTLxxWG-CTERM-specific)